MSARNPRRALAALLITVVALATAPLPGHGVSPPASAPSPAAAGGSDATSLSSTGIDGDWWSAARAAMIAAEYAVTPGPGGVLQAPNREHGLRTFFDPDGIRVVSRTDPRSDWELGWTTTRWGRTDLMRPAEAVSPVADDRRVVYARAGIVEWYENTPRGVEQGFTLHRSPPGAGALCIEGSLTECTNEPRRLLADLDPSGRWIDFSHDGAHVLRYRDLVVVDACGRELPSRLELGGDHVRIVVDDRDATYPVVVDPLIVTPDWIFESEQGGSLFAAAVATAGDVNGDGYSDVIVGAPDYDSGTTDQGKVYLHLGSPSGPSPTPDWTNVGGLANTYLGSSVSSAGDVNGDGYDDVIVGARLYSNGQTDEGACFVWYGGAGGLGPSGALTGIDWLFESNQAFAELGNSVACAGDVNGDGFADVAFGTWRWDGAVADEGRLTVFYGSAAGLGFAGSWVVTGGAAGARLGASVSTAGDVNGDGYDDVIAGATGYEWAGAPWGAAFVWGGGASGLPAGATPASAMWSATDGIDDTNYGISVSSAGDVNGDGYADVLVGSPLWSSTAPAEGAAFAYLGTASGPTLLPVWSFGPAQEDGYAGTVVASAGDVNGDGYADVVVGAPGVDGPTVANVGGAFLFEGGAAGLSGTASESLYGTVSLGNFGMAVAAAGDVDGDGFGDVLVGSPTSGDGFAACYRGVPEGLDTSAAFGAGTTQNAALWGSSVAGAGDVNGDGYSDVIIGSPLYDSGEVDEGAAFVYFGSRDGLDLTGVWRAESNQAGARLGASVAMAGDVDGDGYDDVIVGAPYYDQGGVAGAAFAWFGSPTGLGAFGVPTNVDWREFGEAVGDLFGTSVASAGDVDGDGFADVLIGASGYDGERGRVYLHHGGESGPGAVAAWTTSGTLPNATFGGRVATAGDVNADGFSDVIVGAPAYSDVGGAEAGEGTVFVWHGSPGGLGASGDETTADWHAESNQGAAAFGWSAASAGDVNGDGYSDVIVGAYLYDADQVDEGRAFVWLGGASGLGAPGEPGNADWAAGSGLSSVAYGHDVAGAGDVNGDGYSDVIVGSYAWSAGAPSEGAALVYTGSVSGPSRRAGWATTGGLASARLGWSVCGAGDVNGDGYADVLVGAPGWSDATIHGGRTLGFLGNGGDGMDRPVQQRRIASTTPVSLLGVSDDDTAFRISVAGRTPAGRGDVRLEWEVKPLGVPFDGAGLGRSPAFLDTGTPVSGAGSQLLFMGFVTGLEEATSYHWRARVVTRSPLFPHSPWFSLPGNATTEKDIRTGGTILALADGEAPAGLPPIVSSAFPNPTRSHTRLEVVLDRPGRVEVTVHDVAGRYVTSLHDRDLRSPRHTIRWDGRDARGHPVPSGVYLVRLVTGEGVRSRKVLVTR